MQRQSSIESTPRPATPSSSGAPSALPHCGPDATNWFVNQVNIASGDPAVNTVKADLASADTHASHLGLTAAQLGESGGATAVQAQEMILGGGAPARNPTIASQMSASRASIAAVGISAVSGGPSPTRTWHRLLMMQALASAAVGWRSLVNHGARYDFKAHKMSFPKAVGCPDTGCPGGTVGIITLCPGANTENCYESDVPGNIFYALIGKYIGWSHLTLQLGSQYAELTDTVPRPARPVVTWDTPDDTAAITFGYGLPLPLTSGVLCGGIGSVGSSLALRHGCQDCLTPTYPGYT